jgi:HAD superfamily hydrolase (TIGR01509 family)
MLPSPFQSCKAFLFDLDGVLVDSYYCWYDLLQDAMKEQGKPAISLEEFHKRWGQGPEEDREAFFPEWTIEQVIAFYVERFHRYTNRAGAEKGSGILLQQIRGMGKKIVVASNSPTAIALDLLKNAGLEMFPHLVIGADQVKNPKPAPDLLLKALDLLSISKDQVVYVGDSIYDARAAQTAGIFFVGYKRPGDLSVKDFEQFMQLL